MRRAISLLALALLVALAVPTVSLAQGTGGTAPSGSAVTKQHPKTHKLKTKAKATVGAEKKAKAKKAKAKKAQKAAKTSKHEYGQKK